ncbi:polyphenol oxidase family protein [Bifidobacterium pullorum]|uniref:polyphenol oxidase family protein n=1 Tax=Bifidobacterium pullorum TaxID=78448 RepID=UPI0025A4473C|nr:polyphenol oxidase family protein [Bifidobacterium pullorum]MDM8322479.1 polyphenol oxidase family protein [Bifidobacterium pullorum]
MSTVDTTDGILGSNAISPTDKNGRPIPVTIPVMLAPGVRVVYTTRLGGVSQGDAAGLNLGGKNGDDPKHVAANRAALADEIDARLSLVSQIHSGTAIDMDETYAPNRDYGFDATGGALPDGGEPEATVIEADAQVTTRRGVALGVFAADCLPVLLADSEAGVIGVAHCGRRGLQQGVIGETVRMMTGKGASVERMVATLGPCICGDCYEVGESIAAEFDARFPGTATTTRFGGPGIDIAAAALQELAAAGITDDRIVESRPRVAAATQYLSEDDELAALCRTDGEGEPELAARIDGVRHSLCTLENPLWYSHRRAALADKSGEGRMLALIVRE